MQNRIEIYRLVNLADTSFNAKKYKKSGDTYTAALKLVKQQIPDSTPLSEVDNDIRLYCAYLTYAAASCTYSEHTLGKEHVESTPEGIAYTEAAYGAMLKALTYIEDASYTKESDNEKIEEIRRFENICIQNLAEQYCNYGYTLYNGRPVDPTIAEVDVIVDLLTKSRALYYKLVGLFSESENEDEQARHEKYEKEVDFALACAYELRADTYFDLYENTTDAEEKITYLELACANYKTAIDTTDNCGGYEQENLFNLYSSLLNCYYPLDLSRSATYLQPAINMANRLLDNFSSLTSSHLEELLAFVEFYTTNQPHKASHVTKPRTHVLTAMPTNLANLSSNQLRSLIYLLKHPGTAFTDIPGNIAITLKKEIKKTRAETDLSTVPAKKQRINTAGDKSQLAATVTVTEPDTSMPVESAASKDIQKESLPQLSTTGRIPKKLNPVIRTVKRTPVPLKPTDRSTLPILPAPTPRYIYNYTELNGLLDNSAFLGKVKASLKTKNRSELTADLSNLGNVSLADPRRYFTTNEDIRSYAKIFMETFWRREENRTLVKEAHKKKTLIKHQSTLTDSSSSSSSSSTSKKMHAACISFFTVRIEGTLYCFVASSGKNNLDKYSITNALKQCATSMKLENPDMPEFLILDRYSDAYNDLVLNVLKKLHGGKIVGEHHPERPCAEKFLMSMLTKIMTAFPASQVEAAVNLEFYPYQKNRDYSNDNHVIVPERNSAGFWGNDYFYRTIPCCASCSTNRDSMFTILESVRAQALQQNTDRAENKPYRSVRSTSPFHERESDIIKKLHHSSNKINSMLAKKTSSSSSSSSSNSSHNSSDESDIIIESARLNTSSESDSSSSSLSTNSHHSSPAPIFSKLTNQSSSLDLSQSPRSSSAASISQLHSSSPATSASKLHSSSQSIGSQTQNVTPSKQHTDHRRDDSLAVKPATHHRERDYAPNNHHSHHPHGRNASGSSRNRDDSPKRFESHHASTPRSNREYDRYESSTHHSTNSHSTWHRPTDQRRPDSDYRDRRDNTDHRDSKDNPRHRDSYRR
jgi:hypothetical protein